MSDQANEGNNPAGLRGSTEGERARHGTATRIGLGPRGVRLLDLGGVAFIVLFALGWVWSIGYARSAANRGEPVPEPGRTLAAALTRTDAPTAAYVTDAAVKAFAKDVRGRSVRGRSGRVRASTVLPGDTAVLEIGAALKRVADIDLITLLPFSAKQNGRIGLYYIGNWPAEGGARGPRKAPPGRYANPRGFIQVTPQNQDTPVSRHFRLRHFLTHDQPDVWPKYLVLEMRLIDKLELVLADLERRGVRTDGVVVMSGFRTPQYNVGGGNTGGRAGLSRHMYGDAADIYIDNDHNGTMDDLNHDGRVDIRDAQFIAESVERVEQANPELVGGAGVYVPCCGHGPFIHIDARGYRARWTGSGGD